MQIALTPKVRRVARTCTVQLCAVAFTLSFITFAVPAMAQPLPPEWQRTVEWYATHPVEREQVRRICLNDPGHLARSPDCINAKRGDLEAATRASRLGSRGIDMSDPDTPEYWTRRPGDRTVKLAYCNRMTPEEAARATCGPARQSLLMEQRDGVRR